MSSFSSGNWVHFHLARRQNRKWVLRKPGSRLKITGYKGCGTVAPAHLLQRRGDAQLPRKTRVPTHQNTVAFVGFARDTSPLVTITTEGEAQVVSMSRSFTPSRLWSTCRSAIRANRRAVRARARAKRPSRNRRGSWC